jgi:hypothetical protein
MLVKGDARVRIRTGEIRRLPCSDHLKEIVHRCIGERRKRYESAGEKRDAVLAPRGPARGEEKSLAPALGVSGALEPARRQYWLARC